jgi:16S rRNA (guanine966-N2)-methyltransferase
VKQAIVNVLRSRIPGAMVCELFAGTGALGIELLSAGAAGAVFVEQDRRTVRVLKENLKPFPDRAQVFAGDVRRVIPRLGRTFDIVLADPPYGLGLDALAAELVARHSLLAEDGVLVIEQGRRDTCEIPVGLRLAKSYLHGDTRVLVLERGQSPAQG